MHSSIIDLSFRNSLRKILFITMMMIHFIACQTPTPRITTVELLDSSRHSVSILIEDILQNLKFLPDSVGYIVVDLASGKEVDSKNADEVFMTASTSKIPATVAALEILGSKYRFETKLAYTGEIRNGILHGDLYLKGSGDPLFSVSDLMSFAFALRKEGIMQVIGRFIYDQSFFIPSRAINQEQDLDASYNPGMSALSLDFNQAKVRWFPTLGNSLESNLSNEELKLQYYFTPAIDLFQLNLNDSGIRSSFKSIEPQKASDDKNLEEWKLFSGSPWVSSEKIPIRNAGEYCAQVLRDLSARLGVVLPNPEEGILPVKARRLWLHHSRPLDELVGLALEYSNNLVTELMAVVAFRQKRGGAISAREAALGLEQWWKTALPHVNWKGFRFSAASGLSVNNKMSPRQMAAVLSYAWKKNDLLSRPYFTLLPISGWKGTLTDRLTEPNLAFSVWAKTGTMDYVSTLAGYLLTQSHSPLGFVIMISEPHKRSLSNVSAPRQDTQAWQTRAKQVQERFLEKWIH